MSAGEKAGLIVVLAVAFGLWFGLGSGVLACGILGAFVGGGLGAIIE